MYLFKEINEDKVIEKLENYALMKNKQLYVVGGVVRDEIFGVKRNSSVKDIDLTGTLSMDEIKEFLKQNNLKYEVKNQKLQVVSFWENNNKIYEYARMRREEYADKNSHTPSNVEFENKVEEDAKRRDFTTNSIYYVRHSTELIDPYMGVEDIKKGLLKTVLDPIDTLKVDPARIIRLVEISCRFNFKIDKDILLVLKQKSNNIFKLSENRLKKELSRLYETNKYLSEGSDYLVKVSKLLKDIGIEESKLKSLI